MRTRRRGSRPRLWEMRLNWRANPCWRRRTLAACGDSSTDRAPVSTFRIASCVSRIAEEIERSLDFLEADLSDVPERQHSMRAVFDHSWSLLSERQRFLVQVVA